MWGFERFGKKTEKQRTADGKELGGAPSPDASKARKLADAAIAKAAQRDGLPVIGTDSGFPDTEAMPVASETLPRPSDASRLTIAKPVRGATPVSADGLSDGLGLPGSHIDKKTLEKNLDRPVFSKPLLPDAPVVADPVAPNLWGADHVQPPKTGYKATPVSTVGAEEFRVDSRALDAALEDPGFGGGAESDVAGYEKTRSARKLAPNPNTAPLVMPGAELNRASDELNDPKARREADWRMAQGVVRTQDQGAGLSTFRTQGEDLDTRWKRMKAGEELVRDGAKQPEGLATYQGRGANMPSVEKDRERTWQEARHRAAGTEMPAAKQELSREEVLRVGRIDKINQLVQMIRLAKPGEAALMREVLARAVANYERDHGKFPD